MVQVLAAIHAALAGRPYAELVHGAWSTDAAVVCCTVCCNVWCTCLKAANMWLRSWSSGMLQKLVQFCVKYAVQ